MKLLPIFPGGRSHFSLNFWASLNPDQDWPTGFGDIQDWKCGRRRTDDGPLVYYKLTLWAFGSGELKSNYLRNNYNGKLLWFCNYSVENFKTSEAQVTVSSPPPFIADYLTSKTGSWAIFNKICQNDITCYCHNGLINLLFFKIQKIKTGWGSGRPGHGIFTPVVKIIWGRGEDTPVKF